MHSAGHADVSVVDILQVCYPAGSHGSSIFNFSEILLSTCGVLGSLSPHPGKHLLSLVFFMARVGRAASVLSLGLTVLAWWLRVVSTFSRPLATCIPLSGNLMFIPLAYSLGCLGSKWSFLFFSVFPFWSFCILDVKRLSKV